MELIHLRFFNIHKKHYLFDLLTFFQRRWYKNFNTNSSYIVLLYDFMIRREGVFYFRIVLVGSFDEEIFKVF